MLAQEDAMAHAPQPFLRHFKRLVLDHYVIWTILGILIFGGLLYSQRGDLSSFSAVIAAVMIVLFFLNMVIRAYLHRFQSRH